MFFSSDPSLLEILFILFYFNLLTHLPTILTDLSLLLHTHFSQCQLTSISFENRHNAAKLHQFQWMPPLLWPWRSTKNPCKASGNRLKRGRFRLKCFIMISCCVSEYLLPFLICCFLLLIYACNLFHLLCPSKHLE